MKCESCGNPKGEFYGKAKIQLHLLEDGSPATFTPGLPPGQILVPESICFECWGVYARSLARADPNPLERYGQLYGDQAIAVESAWQFRLHSAVVGGAE